MTTWSEVQAHIRSHYRLQTDTLQHFILAWQIEDLALEDRAAGASPAPPSPLGQPVVQGVHGQHLTVGDKDFLVLRAEVASDRVMSPLQALRQSARLLLGALVLNGNQYVLRYSTPLRSLDLDDLDYALKYLAREAAATRARLAPHAGGTRGLSD
jgi:hypothetical protein